MAEVNTVAWNVSRRASCTGAKAPVVDDGLVAGPGLHVEWTPSGTGVLHACDDKHAWHEWYTWLRNDAPSQEEIERRRSL